jgi:CelD/BcsL family acetyltransferase involved in cellulose biosynthesis
MSARIVRFESAAALRAAAPAWNDLWHRTTGVLPTGRAEFVANWIEHFAPQQKFVAVGVEQDGQLVAALPLIEQRKAKFLRAGMLPRNDWCWGGSLLVDQTADTTQALQLLLGECRKLGWPLLWFDAAQLQDKSWQALLAAAETMGLSHLQRERFTIGTIEIADQLNHDWKAYEKAWSGNHRRHMRKALRRSDEEGGVELDIRTPKTAAEIEPLLREGFEVEHRSWKGREGTSVLASPAMWKYYLDESALLAAAGVLELVFLRFRGKAIGFEYGWSSRGIYYTPKVGFDDEFSRFSPGQLLRNLLLEDFFKQPECLAVDFLGPLSEATAKWSTRTYPISRLVIATGAVGKSLLWAEQNIFRRLRNAQRKDAVPAELPIVSLEPKGNRPLAAEPVEA